MPTSRLFGFAPGAAVALSVLQGQVSATASVPQWGVPIAGALELLHGADTNFEIRIVSEDLLGVLTFTVTIGGSPVGTFARTAGQQTSGVAVNHIAPVVSATATPGTYAATTGLWTHGIDPAPTPAYQWARNGTVIAGATGATYATVAADQATTLTCRVTVAGVTATSNGIAIPGAGVSVAAATNGLTFTSASSLTVTVGTAGITIAEA
jgi:hypothetical protein